MKEFNSLDDILDFAIESEQNAIDFYGEMATKASNDEMKQIFESFAIEEMGHKSKLLDIKQIGVVATTEKNVKDLKMSDYIVKVQPSANMLYGDALILAMQREKAQFKLYSNLASRIDDPNMKQVFEMLAMEESKHKLRFEIEYDEYVLKEN